MSRLRLMAVALICLLGAAQVRAGPDPGRMEALRQVWQQAVTHMRDNEPRAAIPLLEALLRELPGDAGVRAELALALAMAGDADRARALFAQLLGMPLTEPRRAAVQAHLARIEARRDWQLSLSFGLSPQTNPSRSSEAATVTVGGLKMVMRRSADPGIGAGLTGEFRWMPQIGRDRRAVFGLRGAAQLYEQSVWNDVLLRAETGLSFAADRGRSLEAGLYLEGRWLGSKRYSREKGLYLAWTLHASPRARLVLRGEAGQIEVPDIPARDADVLRLSLSAVRVPAPDWQLRGQIGLTVVDAALPSESNRKITLGGGVSRAFGNALQIGADLTLGHTAFGAPHRVFGIRRDETDARLRIQIANGNLAWRGYSPVLEFGHERRSSSIGIFDYANSFATLRIARRF